jgi:hypothetical protein
MTHKSTQGDFSICRITNPVSQPIAIPNNFVRKPGSYQGANACGNATEPAQADESAAPFHHSLYILEGIKSLLLLIHNKSTLKYKVSGSRPYLQIFFDLIPLSPPQILMIS